MTHERLHLIARLEVQTRSCQLYPDDSGLADELARIQAELLALSLEELGDAPIVRDDDPPVRSEETKARLTELQRIAHMASGV